MPVIDACHYAPAMRVEMAAAAFVRARRRDVHPYLADVGGYGSWWPGARSRAATSGILLDLRPAGRLARPQRLRVAVSGERPDLGVELTVQGAFTGSAEWYYLDEPAGTVVQYLLRAQTPPRGATGRIAAHRACVGAGLQGLKALLEAGRPPGAEPPQSLRADQAAATAQFEARVAAHRRRMRREQQ